MHTISLERVKWFCWFFACSYLHLVGYPLKLPKYTILDWHCQAIGSKPIRLSDVLNLKNSKTISSWFEVSSWFFASIEATKICYFVLRSQNTLGWSDFLILILGVNCYIVFVVAVFWIIFLDKIIEKANMTWSIELFEQKGDVFSRR